MVSEVVGLWRLHSSLKCHPLMLALKHTAGMGESAMLCLFYGHVEVLLCAPFSSAKLSEKGRSHSSAKDSQF